MGIHTGKILGGIIGSKIVRYDVFGQDVLIAKLIEHHGTAGCVTVSEQFHNFLKKKPFIWDTFDWTEVKNIKIDNSEKLVTLFRVEKIFAIDGSSSEELLEPQHEQHMGGKDLKLSGRGRAAVEEHLEPSSKPNLGDSNTHGNNNGHGRREGWDEDDYMYQ